MSSFLRRECIASSLRRIRLLAQAVLESTQHPPGDSAQFPAQHCCGERACVAEGGMINSLFVMSPTGYVRSLSFPPSDFPSCPWTVRQIRVGMVRVRGGGKAGTGSWSVGQTAAVPPRPSTPLVPDPPAIHATQTPGGSISSAGPCSLVASVGYPRGLSTASASSLSLSLDTIMPSLGCGPSSRQREREKEKESERVGWGRPSCSALLQRL